MPRRQKRNPNFLDNIVLSRFERLKKFEVDDHTDLFVGQRAKDGSRHIILKSRYPGNTQYLWWDEAHARNLAECITDLLDTKMD